MDKQTQDSSLQEEPKKEEKRDKKRKKSPWVWPIQATVVSLVLAAVFSLLAEVVLTDAHIAIAVVLLVVLILVSIFFDMLGLAVAGCDGVALASMASRKVRGAKIALRLVHKAGMVSSILNDIVGDTIGIITGVCGAALAYKMSSSLSGWAAIAVSVAVSAVIAAVTIGGKAAMKQVALHHTDPIVLGMGKFLSVFCKEDRKKR